MNKNIKRTFWVLFAMFAVLIIYLAYFTIVRAPDIVNNPYNLRLSAKEGSIKRGNIEDINGVVIAESVLEGDSYERIYNYPRMYCHITGYTASGKTGVESAYNAELLTLHNETLQRFLYILTNKVFKKGEFSLTGLNPFEASAYAADSLPYTDFDDFDDNASGAAAIPETTEETSGQTEQTTEQTTEEPAQDSDIDAEIKDIYSDIENNSGASLDDIISDGYHSENDLFAPLKDGYVLKGNSVVLSVDHRIQEKAFNLLGERNGSVIVSDVNTGKIKAMVSYPNYNPQTVAENWEYLTTDEKNTPLLNRAAQGLYPPGSVFKIAVAQLLIDSNQEDMSFTCEGTNRFGNKVLRCYNENVHGTVDLTSAFAKSCNGFFAEASLSLGPSRLITQALSLGFNKDNGFALEHSKSIFSLTEDSDNSELIDTAIGQGKTMVTPLDINMITAAAANGGTMYTPQITQGIKSPSGKLIKEFSPKVSGAVMSEETSSKIRSLMRSVVTDGTATAANSDQITIAGKTGTAENGTDNDHIWFTCFAPYENPQYAVTVMLEYAGSGSRAVPIAKELLEYINTLE